MLGVHHPLVKAIRKAARKGGRTEEGFAVAEGFHLLREAVRAGVEIGAVLATPETAAGVDGPLTPHLIPEPLMEQISSVEASQGVLALVRYEARTPAECLGPQALAIVLDGLQDPGNAGTIVRAAEAFGASGVLFLTGSVSPWNPKTLRASAGSLFRLPFAVCEFETLRAELAAGGLALFGAEAHTGRLIQDASLAGPCAILVGNEGRGIPADHARQAEPVRIPTAGVESLNAALAAGIMLYEARRQRS